MSSEGLCLGFTIFICTDLFNTHTVCKLLEETLVRNDSFWCIASFPLHPFSFANAKLLKVLMKKAVHKAASRGGAN